MFYEKLRNSSTFYVDFGVSVYVNQILFMLVTQNYHEKYVRIYSITIQLQLQL